MYETNTTDARRVWRSWMNTLSVVMPCYNHGKYIDEAIQGIIKQDYPANEIIIVNDGSTDNSAERIWWWVRQYDQISVLTNTENMGFCEALNRGIRKASGDWVFCPSADDLTLPYLFKSSMAALSKWPEAGLCSSLTEMVGGAEYRTPVVLKSAGYMDYIESIRTYIKRGSWITTQSVIFKRSAMLEFGLYHPELGSAADGFLIKAIIAKYGAVFIPEVMTYWRRNTESVGLSTAKDPGKALSQIVAVENKLRSVRVPEPFLERYRGDSFRALLGETLVQHRNWFSPTGRFVARSYLYARSKMQ